MSTLEQLGRGLGRTLEQLSEGWRQLRTRAGHALTRFTPAPRQQLETAAEQAQWRGPRWGLLAAEVEEQEAAVTVRLEAPGMEAEDFEIDVLDNVLVVRGEKRAAHSRREGRFHVAECAYGHFERAVPLPAEVDDSRARARYGLGVLEVTLPKSKAHTFRRIEVETG